MSGGRDRCRTEVPLLVPVNGSEHGSACHYHGEVAQELEMHAADLGIEAEEGALGDF